jgi:peroxiredoxin Q/BCP
LPFALIADTDETWCQAFDVIHEKVLYGKKHLGVVRSTFLIAPDGALKQEWRGVKVAGHAQAVLDSIPAA